MSGTRARSPVHRGARSQQGRTLIELMVSLALGLIVAGAGLAIFFSTRENTRSLAAYQESDDNGRQVISILARHLRQAGFQQQAFHDDTWMRTPADDFQSITGCRGGFIDPAAVNAVCANDTSAGGPADSIVVRYATDIAQAATPALRQVAFDSLSGRGTDCLGVRVPNPATPEFADFVVENRFYMAVSAETGQRELHCWGSASREGRPIVFGVEDLRITFSLDRQDGAGRDFSTDNYVRADEVTSAEWQWNDLGASSLSTRSRRVLAVSVCLLVRAEHRGEQHNAWMYGCNGEQRVIPSGYAYRAVRSTIVLRNHVP